MNNTELEQWAFEQLEALRQQVIEIRKLESIISAYRESICSLSGIATDGTKVQTTKRTDVLETRVVKLVSLQEHLADRVIEYDYLKNDRLIGSRLNRLPCNESCVLVYRFLCGMTFDQISEKMDTCSLTVRRWQKKGLLMYGQMFYYDDQNSPNMDRLEGLQDGL